VVQGRPQVRVGEGEAVGGAPAGEEQLALDDARGPVFFPAERAGGGQAEVEGVEGQAVRGAKEVAVHGEADGLVSKGESAA